MIEGQAARVVAGYCWRWKSKKDPEAWDVVLPEHDFRMRWNLTQHGSGWLAHPESITEIGCIHTCQGLDLNYVGVVIGPDLVMRDGELITVPEAGDRYDSSMRGYKTRLNADPEWARADARRIILNGHSDADGEIEAHLVLAIVYDCTYIRACHWSGIQERPPRT